MIVRCWGARGSIAVSGSEYVKYGGDTTCMEIRSKNGDIIIVDAGSGIRRAGNRLLDENNLAFNMIFTHAHWDHILGFPFFKPIYLPETRINMYGCPLAQGHIRDLLAKTMAPPYFPVGFNLLQARIDYHGECNLSFNIGPIEITPIALSHPNMGTGFKFQEDGHTFVFLTDNELGHIHRGGLPRQDYLEFSRGADLLVHDAEYTPQEYERNITWGHSSYTDALELALEAEVGAFGLYHHNQDRSDSALDLIVEDCRRIIAERGADMRCFALTQNDEFII